MEKSNGAKHNRPKRVVRVCRAGVSCKCVAQVLFSAIYLAKYQAIGQGESSGQVTIVSGNAMKMRLYERFGRLS